MCRRKVLLGVASQYITNTSIQYTCTLFIKGRGISNYCKCFFTNLSGIYVKYPVVTVQKSIYYKDTSIPGELLILNSVRRSEDIFVFAVVNGFCGEIIT